MSFTIALTVCGWLAGWWLWGRPLHLGNLPDNREASGTAGAPGAHRAGVPAPTRRVRVIIPARNEATTLPPLLHDLADPRPGADRPWDVLVVDDHSTDGTGAVAAAINGVEVLEAPPLPSGWTGKCWALHSGVKHLDPAPDDVLVFLDADVRLESGALEALVADLEFSGGAVSVQPFHTTVRADEQLSLFPGLLSLLGTGAGRRRGCPAALFGPIIATTAADYDAVGGHEAVRSEVIEDVALGQRYLAIGQRTTVRLGSPLARYRMYPAGLRQLIEGWSKNLASGSDAIPSHRTVLSFLWVTALLSVALGLPGVPGGPAPTAVVGIAAYGAFVVQVGVFARKIGTFSMLSIVAYPIPLVAFMGLFARSAWRTLVRRRVVWRGRTIAIPGARSHR